MMDVAGWDRDGEHGCSVLCGLELANLLDLCCWSYLLKICHDTSLPLFYSNSK